MFFKLKNIKNIFYIYVCVWRCTTGQESSTSVQSTSTSKPAVDRRTSDALHPTVDRRRLQLADVTPGDGRRLCRWSRRRVPVRRGRWRQVTWLRRVGAAQRRSVAASEVDGHESERRLPAGTTQSSHRTTQVRVGRGARLWTGRPRRHHHGDGTVHGWRLRQGRSSLSLSSRAEPRT